MYIDCEIIRDLLPLYKDGALSPKGTAAVRNHLADCPYCRRYLRNSIITSSGGGECKGDFKKLAVRIKRDRTVKYTLIGAVITALLGYGIYKTIQDQQK